MFFDRHPGEHKPAKDMLSCLSVSRGISIPAKWADNLIETPLEIATNEVDEAENHQGIEWTLFIGLFTRIY